MAPEPAADPAPVTTPDPVPRRLHPASPFLVAVSLVPRLFVPLVVVGMRGETWLLAGAAVLLAASGVVAYMRTDYTLDDDQFVLRSGWFQRTTKVVAPDRVQQVQMVRKLRHQVTGTTMVRIELAGARAHVTLDAVAEAEARRIQEALERGRRRTAPAASPLAVPPPPATELLTTGTGQLVVGGLTGASLLLVPALALALGDEALELADSTGIELSPDQARGVPLAVLVVVGILVTGGLAAAQMVLRHHRLTISRAGPDIRAERGLLERRSIVIPLRRVQMVRTSETVLRRLVGLRSVDVRTAAVSDAEGTGSVDDLIPVASPADADRLAAILAGTGGAGDVPVADRRHPRVARSRAAVRRAVVLVPLAVVASIPSRSWAVGGAAAVAAVVLAVLWARAWFPRLRHGRTAGPGGLDPRPLAGGPVVIVAEDGVLRWQRRIVPAARVQSASVRQSPRQRRAGVVDLRLDVAGGRAVRLRDVGVEHADDLVRLLDRVPLRVAAI